MLAFRLLATLLCAYVACLGMGVLTRLDSALLIGPSGSMTHRAIHPLLERYLELVHPVVGALGLVLLGVATLVVVWRGAFKKKEKKK